MSVSKMKDSSNSNNNNKNVLNSCVLNGSCITRCHEMSDSLFSSTSGFTNFRGLVNWSFILLVLATGGSALENILEYGILIDPIMWLSVFLKDPSSWPSVILLIALNIFVLTAFVLELLLSQGLFTEQLGVYLHTANLFLEITFPAVVILRAPPKPCKAIIKLLLEMGKKVDDTVQVYPDNLYVKDVYYFICAPTLCYDLNFPRSARIRMRFLLKRVAEMVFLCGLMISLIQQWIIPTINNSLVPFQEQIFSQMFERLLKLAVPNHLIWLIFFYWMFHSCLNVLAEVLRFGDRTFYKDWWNADTIQYFWRTWNIPVHKWASRHLYKPLLRVGVSKIWASIIVFFVSAFFHEYLVSVPLHMFRVWSFMGLLAQIPLAILTENFGKYGNVIVWMSLIIGLPMAVLMYYHDYYVMHR